MIDTVDEVLGHLVRTKVSDLVILPMDTMDVFTRSPTITILYDKCVSPTKWNAGKWKQFIYVGRNSQSY